MLPLDVLFIPMAPKREFPDFGLGKIGSRLEIELDHPGPDIGAADVCAEDSVKRPEHPRWRQMHGAQESGLVWIIMDRNQLDIDLLRLKKNGSPADDQFTDAASAESAPDDEPLRVLPFFQFQETPDHQGEFLRELLDSRRE